MRYGLTEQTIESIRAVLARHPAVERATLFGSRAKGTFKPGSDIDLTLHGDGLATRDLGIIEDELDDLLLPMTMDLSIFDQISHVPLREHIERIGVAFYERSAVIEGTPPPVNAEGRWQTTTLGDVCEVVNGGTPKTGIPEYWDGEHRWITPAEMGKRQSPYVSDTERKITDAGLGNSSARMLPKGSVILSSRAPIGHLVVNMQPMATNQGCKGLIPDKRLDAKFLYHYLASIVELLNSLGTGATFKELSGGKLKEVPMPLPSLPEQQRIAAILDEAFAGIATAKANAEKNLQYAHDVKIGADNAFRKALLVS